MPGIEDALRADQPHLTALELEPPGQDLPRQHALGMEAFLSLQEGERREADAGVEVGHASRILRRPATDNT